MKGIGTGIVIQGTVVDRKAQREHLCSDGEGIAQAQRRLKTALHCPLFVVGHDGDEHTLVLVEAIVGGQEVVYIVVAILVSAPSPDYMVERGGYGGGLMERFCYSAPVRVIVCLVSVYDESVGPIALVCGIHDDRAAVAELGSYHLVPCVMAVTLARVEGHVCVIAEVLCERP